MGRRDLDEARPAEPQKVAVFVVCRCLRGEQATVISAWADKYAAKFEADRWEQDSKTPHMYTEGWLVLVPHAVRP